MGDDGDNGARTQKLRGASRVLYVAVAATLALLLATLAWGLAMVVLASLGILIFGPPLPPMYSALSGVALLFMWAYLSRSLYRRLMRRFGTRR